MQDRWTWASDPRQPQTLVSISSWLSSQKQILHDFKGSILLDLWPGLDLDMNAIVVMFIRIFVMKTERFHIDLYYCSGRATSQSKNMTFQVNSLHTNRHLIKIHTHKSRHGNVKYQQRQVLTVQKLRQSFRTRANFFFCALDYFVTCTF